MTKSDLQCDDPAAWRRGLIIGHATGIIFVALSFSTVAPVDGTPLLPILMLSALASIVVAPALLTRLAKTQFFWYGMLPLLIELPWTLLAYCISCHIMSKGAISIFHPMAMLKSIKSDIPIVMSVLGFNSLIVGILASERSKSAAIRAAIADQENRRFLLRESMWPPKPRTGIGDEIDNR